MCVGYKHVKFLAQKLINKFQVKSPEKSAAKAWMKILSSFLLLQSKFDEEK